MMGTFSGEGSTTAQRDTYIGEYAAALGTTASRNSVLGQASLYHNVVGNDDTALGFTSLAWITGSADIGLGSGSGNSDTAVSNTLYIGSQTSGLGINTIQIDSSIAAGANFTKNMRFSGVVNMPNLTASTVLQLDASKNIISG